MICLEDGDRARRLAVANRANYHTGLVFRYLDSFPRPDDFPVWPDLPPEPTVDELEEAGKVGLTLCGRPRRGAPRPSSVSWTWAPIS